MLILGVDIILSVLIGPPNGSGACLLLQAALDPSKSNLVLNDFAVFCAMASVRPGDAVDCDRFSKLLRRATYMASAGRTPDGTFPNPGPDEVENWRKLALRPLEHLFAQFLDG